MHSTSVNLAKSCHINQIDSQTKPSSSSSSLPRDNLQSDILHFDLSILKVFDDSPSEKVIGCLESRFHETSLKPYVSHMLQQILMKERI